MEWLRNICSIPINFGLDKTNYIVTNIITFVFNLYGQRLLKTDSDKIIRLTECNHNHNIFHLYPLNLKECNQDIMNNTIIIENGLIDGLDLIVPWKSLFSDTITIKINNIDLNVIIKERDKYESMSLLEDTNSYLYESEKITDIDKNIVDILNEINLLLKKCFNNIDIEINLVTIHLKDALSVVVRDIKYSNQLLSCKNISVYSVSKSTDKYLDINKIELNCKLIGTKNLLIGDIFVDSRIVDALPIIYLTDCESHIDFQILIDKFNLDDICLTKLAVSINENKIIVRDFFKMEVNSAIIVSKSALLSVYHVITFDSKYKTCDFEQCICCNIIDIYSLINLTKEYSHTIKTLKNKFVSDDVKNYSLSINNLKIIIVGQDSIKIDVKKIIIGENIELLGLNVEYQNTFIVCERCIVNNSDDKNMISFHNISSNNKVLDLESEKIIYKKIIDNNNTKHTVTFCRLKSPDIIETINYVSELINTIKSKLIPNISGNARDNSVNNHEKVSDDNKEPFVSINIYNSIGTLKYKSLVLDLFVDQSNICLTTKTAIDTIINISLKNIIIAKISLQTITKDFVSVNSLKIFIDPDILDQLIYFSGLLKPSNETIINNDYNQDIPPNVLEKIQEALSNTIISTSIEDLENSLQISTDGLFMNSCQNDYTNNLASPMIKILSDSVNNLRTAIINDYSNDVPNNNFKLNIDSVHIYLYDKLTIEKTKSFLFIVIKNSSFVLSHKKIIPNNPHIIIQNRNTEQSNIKTSYKLLIDGLAFIDNDSIDSNWKYLLKFKNKAINIHTILFNDTVKTYIRTSDFHANIREETLIRLFAFISNPNQFTTNNSKQTIFIEKFFMGEINGTINYLPIVFKNISFNSINLSIQDYQINIPIQSIRNVNGFDKLTKIIKTNIEKEINPKNVLQFVPNINIIEPYAMPITRIIALIGKYFKHDKNKQKLRKITRSIQNNMGVITGTISHNLQRIFDGLL